MVGLALFIFFYLGTRGREAEIEIHGREAVEAGELLTIPLVFRNTSATALKEVEFSIFLPEGSTLIEDTGERPAPPRFTKKIEDFGPREERTEMIRVRLWGYEGEEKKVEATFLYRPENLRAKFSSRASRTFTISQVPLALSWEMPDIVSAGQEVEMVVHFLSNASGVLEDLSLQMEYPPGFSFLSAKPQPDFGNTVWKLGRLVPGGEGKIVLRGKLEGGEGEIKAFRARLGLWDESSKTVGLFTDSSHEIKIAVTPISIQGFLDGRRERTISPGENLRFTLRYKNNTAFSVKNVVVSAFLESGLFRGQEESLIQIAPVGGALDFTTLDIGQGGVFDTLRRAIVWSPSNTPALEELEPGESGELSFSIQSRARLPMQKVEDKNYIVRLKSTIETRTSPAELAGTELASSDLLDFKVKSKVLFSGRAVYRSSPLPNAGPLPPKIGSKTTYTIIWEIRNFTNDLQNVEVTTSLPPNVQWEGSVFPGGADISFEALSGRVRWRIGSMKAGTGVVTPVLVGAFKVSITPSEADLGKSPILVNESKFTGIDTFTGETLTETVGAGSTALLDDPLTTVQEWEVVR